MARLVIYLVLSLCLHQTLVYSQKAALHGEKSLLKTIFEDYNPVARPVIDYKDSVQVAMSFYIKTLNELNLKTRTLSTTGLLTLVWKDEWLTWDPEDYDGVDSVAVPPHMVWLPAFTLENSRNPNIYIEEYYTLVHVTVHHDGKCKWELAGNFITECDVQVAKFPYDKQTCIVKFGNWVHSERKVNLTFAENAGEVLFNLYSKSDEWEIALGSFTRSQHTVTYSDCQDCKEIYPKLYFIINLKRKSYFYTVNMVVPSVVLSFLSVLVFFLPAESGEKMSMSVTLLLSYTIFLLMATENIPHSSDGTPIIVTYLLFSMYTTSFSVMAEVFVLRMHYHPDDMISTRLKAMLGDANRVDRLLAVVMLLVTYSGMSLILVLS